MGTRRRRRARHAFFLTLALALAGCGSSDEGSAAAPPIVSPQAEATRAEPDTQAETTQAETTQAETTRAEATPPEATGERARPTLRRMAPADARAYRGEIAAARREARADPARGLAAFERLIAAHPTDPRLHCEAGLLAHRAGRAEDAARLLAAGTRLFGDLYAVPAPLRTPVAMCLYNRGLVEEAAGEIARARYSYRASLRLRPNATVERRLMSLPAPEPPPIEEGASIEALTARLVAEAEASGGEDFRGEPLEWVLRIEVLAHRPPGDGAPDLALLQISRNEDLIVTQQVVLAMQFGAGYRLFSLLDDTDDMTDHGNTDMVSLGDGQIEVIPTSAGRVVRASFGHGHTSGVDACDDECCYGWSSVMSQDVLALCTLGDAAQCQPITTALEVTPGERYSDCEDDATGGEPATRWERSLTIDPDGTTHLRDLAGTPPARPAPGDRPFVELVQLLGEGQ